MAELVEAFQMANVVTEQTGAHPMPYQVVLLSASGGRIASDTSAFVWTEPVSVYTHPIEFHAVFLVNGLGLQSALRDARLADWLTLTCREGGRFFASARGRQWLGTAGLRASAPHAPPTGLHASAGLNAERLIVAGLRLIESDRGAAIAEHVANRITFEGESRLPSLRSQLDVQSVSDSIQASIRWLKSNWDAPIAMRDLAQAAAMSERTFLRRFKVETGITPSEYLLRVRLSAIGHLLVRTDLPIEKIARRCGVGNGARLAKLFRSRLGVTPSEYRHKHIGERHLHVPDTLSIVSKAAAFF